MANLLDILNERIVIADGATGTYLYELGVPLNHCLEEVNLSQSCSRAFTASMPTPARR
jgi:methionine synthase I (cobalamin-dependent)